MSRPMVMVITPWRFEWSGGRLADVSHIEAPGATLDCMSVGDYDWKAGVQLAPFTKEVLRESAEGWIRDNGGDYLRELPYLIGGR